MESAEKTRRRGQSTPLEPTENALILAALAYFLVFSGIPLSVGILQSCWSVAYDMAGFVAVGMHLLPVPLFLLLSCFRLTTKPILIGFLLFSSVTVFALNYSLLPTPFPMTLEPSGVITATKAKGLIPEFLLFVVSLGVVPAVYVARVKIFWRGWPVELKARAKLIAIIVVAFGVPVIAFDQQGAVEIGRTLGYGATLKDSVQPLLKCLVSP